MAPVTIPEVLGGGSRGMSGTHIGMPHALPEATEEGHGQGASTTSAAFPVRLHLPEAWAALGNQWRGRLFPNVRLQQKRQPEQKEKANDASSRTIPFLFWLRAVGWGSAAVATTVGLGLGVSLAMTDPSHLAQTIRSQLPPTPLFQRAPLRAPFAEQSTWEVATSWAVFHVCAWSPLVHAAPRLLAWAHVLHMDPIVHAVLRPTFFAHFCGGEDASSLFPVMGRLSRAGVGAILDVSIEADLTAADTAASPLDGPSVSERVQIDEEDPYNGLNVPEDAETWTLPSQHQPHLRAQEDYASPSASASVTAAAVRARDLFLQSIQVAARAPSSSTRNAVAVKVTALGSPQALQGINDVLHRVHSLWASSSSSLSSSTASSTAPSTLASGSFITREAWCQALGTAAGAEALFDRMDLDEDGVINRMDVYQVLLNDMNAATEADAAAQQQHSSAPSPSLPADWTFPSTSVVSPPTSAFPSSSSSSTSSSSSVPSLIGTLVALGAHPRHAAEYARMVGHLRTVCDRARSERVSVMVDAEQTYFQDAIDLAALGMAAQFNQAAPTAATPAALEGGAAATQSGTVPEVEGTAAHPVVYNTYQMYLKSALPRLEQDVALAERQGWHFAAKLVRGAYMVSERERAVEKGYLSPIHDTLDDTHRAYHAAVDLLLRRMTDAHPLLPSPPPSTSSNSSGPFTPPLESSVDTTGSASNNTTSAAAASASSHPAPPPISVLVASHNAKSVVYTLDRMATYGLAEHGRDNVTFGQLKGMHDVTGYALANAGYRVFKYIPYGPLHEVLPYLLRRAQENSAVLGAKTVHLDRQVLWHELVCRFKGM